MDYHYERFLEPLPSAWPTFMAWWHEENFRQEYNIMNERDKTALEIGRQVLRFVPEWREIERFGKAREGDELVNNNNRETYVTHFNHGGGNTPQIILKPKSHTVTLEDGRKVKISPESWEAFSAKAE